LTVTKGAKIMKFEEIVNRTTKNDYRAERSIYEQFAYFQNLVVYMNGLDVNELAAIKHIGDVKE